MNRPGLSSRILLQNFLRRQHACRAHHAAAGVCAACAEVVAFERGAEVCPLRRGTQEEDLVQQQFAVEDVAARDARDGFDVLRRDDLHADDGFADVRRVLLDGRDDRFAEFVALRVVPAAFEIVRRVLHEARHHVLSGRRHVGVDHGWEDHVEIRALRDLPILGVVVGALDVINARADGHRAAMQRRVVSLAFEGSAVKLGSSLNAMLTLPDEPRVRKFCMRCDEFIGEIFLLDELQEGALRVCGGHDDFGLSSSPFSRATPTARPFLTMTCFTLALTLISTPSACAAFRMEPLTPPEPFLAKPQARNAPSISPM